MRKPLLITVMLLATTFSATAQSVSPERAEKNWKKLATIPAGKSIKVRTAKTHMGCTLDRWDQNMLICRTDADELVFTRTEVVSIKVARGPWGWLTSPWFVVPAFSGGVGAIAAEAPHGDVIAGAVLVVLMGFVFLVHLAGG